MFVIIVDGVVGGGDNGLVVVFVAVVVIYDVAVVVVGVGGVGANLLANMSVSGHP